MPAIESLQDNAEEAASLLKSLANPARLMVLCALVNREHTAGELEGLVGLNQPAVSQHLARLRREGLVQTRRDGQKIYYAIANRDIRKLLNVLHQIYCH